MRKWIIAVLVGLTALFLSGFYLVGGRAQQEVKQFVVSGSQVKGITLKLLDYHRGWFSSTADIGVERLTGGQQKKYPASQQMFTLHLKITHGPILRVKRHLSLGLAFIDTHFIFPDSWPVKPMVTSHTFIALDNSIRNQVDVPPFTWSKGLAQFTWKGLAADWHLSGNKEKVKGSVDCKGLHFADTDKRIMGELTDMQMHYHQQSNPYAIWVGDGHFSLQKLELTRYHQQQVLLDNLTMDTQSGLNNDLLTLQWRLHLSKLTLKETPYGPGDMTVIISNIDANRLGKIQEQLKQANNPHLSSMERRLMLQTVVVALPTLLQAGAGVELKKFTLQLPEGKVQGYAKIALQKGANVSRHAVLGKLKANASLTIPVNVLHNAMARYAQIKISKQQRYVRSGMQLQLETEQKIKQHVYHQKQHKVVQKPSIHVVPLTNRQILELSKKQTEQQLSEWLKKGILKQEGDSYTIFVQFKSGRLMINGKLFPGVDTEGNKLLISLL